MMITETDQFYSEMNGVFSTKESCCFAVIATDTLHLSPLLSGVDESASKCLKLELVDDDTWQVVSSLAGIYSGGDKESDLRCGSADEEAHGVDKSFRLDEAVGMLEYDDIEDMRVRGNLFYKMDRYSIEYEECKYDFHRRNPGRNEKYWIDIGDGHKMKGNPSQNESAKGSRGVKKTAASVPCNKIKNSGRGSGISVSTASEATTKVLTLAGDANANGILTRNWTASASFHKIEDPVLQNRRTPTFNQLTGPYHEPFCLDIYISKASVRASIIHRATSKVVAVAHSISKDMKFDLKSTKNKGACVSVGQALARRALDDDIHNVVYTPRKGDKLEGKLKVVLDSVVNGGVTVKLKLKQNNKKKLR